MASSEEDAQKMLKQLVKIQGAFDALGGSVQNIAAVSKAMRGLRDITAATAAAQGALAAGGMARAGAALMPAASMVAKVPTPVLLVGLSAAAILALKELGRGPDGGPGQAQGWLGEGYNWIMRKQLEYTKTGKELRELAAGPSWATGEAVAVSQQIVSERKFEAGKSAQEKARAQAELKGAHVGRMDELRLQLHQQMESIADRQRNATRETSRIALDSAREQLRLVKGQYDTHVQIAKQIRGQAQTGLERFGSLDPRGMREAVEASRAVKSGVATRAQEQLAEQYAMRGGRQEQMIRQARTTRGMAGGYHEAFGSEFQHAAEHQERLSREVEIRLRDTRQVIIHVERDDRTLAAEIARQFKQREREKDAQTIRQIRQAIQQERESYNSQYKALTGP